MSDDPKTDDEGEESPPVFDGEDSDDGGGPPPSPPVVVEDLVRINLLSDKIPRINTLETFYDLKYFGPKTKSLPNRRFNDVDDATVIRQHLTAWVLPVPNFPDSMNIWSPKFSQVEQPLTIPARVVQSSSDPGTIDLRIAFQREFDYRLAYLALQAVRTLDGLPVDFSHVEYEDKERIFTPVNHREFHLTAGDELDTSVSVSPFYRSLVSYRRVMNRGILATARYPPQGHTTVWKEYQAVLSQTEFEVLTEYRVDYEQRSIQIVAQNRLIQHFVCPRYGLNFTYSQTILDPPWPMLAVKDLEYTSALMGLGFRVCELIMKDSLAQLRPLANTLTYSSQSDALGYGLANAGQGNNVYDTHFSQALTKLYTLVDQDIHSRILGYGLWSWYNRVSLSLPIEFDPVLNLTAFVGACFLHTCIVPVGLRDGSATGDRLFTFFVYHYHEAVFKGTTYWPQVRVQPWGTSLANIQAFPGPDADVGNLLILGNQAIPAGARLLLGSLYALFVQGPGYNGQQSFRGNGRTYRTSPSGPVSSRYPWMTRLRYNDKTNTTAPEVEAFFEILTTILRWNDQFGPQRRHTSWLKTILRSGSKLTEIVWGNANAWAEMCSSPLTFMNDHSGHNVPYAHGGAIDVKTRDIDARHGALLIELANFNTITAHQSKWDFYAVYEKGAAAVVKYAPYMENWLYMEHSVNSFTTPHFSSYLDLWSADSELTAAIRSYQSLSSFVAMAYARRFPVRKSIFDHATDVARDWRTNFMCDGFILHARLHYSSRDDWNRVFPVAAPLPTVAIDLVMQTSTIRLTQLAALRRIIRPGAYEVTFKDWGLVPEIAKLEIIDMVLDGSRVLTFVGPTWISVESTSSVASPTFSANNGEFKTPSGATLQDGVHALPLPKLTQIYEGSVAGITWVDIPEDMSLQSLAPIRVSRMITPLRWNPSPMIAPNAYGYYEYDPAADAFNVKGADPNTGALVTVRQDQPNLWVPTRKTLRFYKKYKPEGKVLIDRSQLITPPKTY